MISAKIIDCMNTDFARIHPDMMVVEASAKLIKKESIGAPVTDENGYLVGWISETECLQVALQVIYYNQRVATVKDVMRREVLSVKPGDDPLHLAQQMLAQKPKVYPVVDSDNKVLGVVTRRRILKMLDEKLVEMSKGAL